MESTKHLANEWLRLDKDRDTRHEIQTLITNNDEAELEKRLRTRISFGTAGLRASMQAGFSRMNSLTVIQASQGLAAYLLENDPDVKHKGVVIGRDARHNSEKFAKLAAAAFVAKGIKVWWYEQIVHTPLVPFGVSELKASAGIMITASHNPAYDNGYKVYWSNGCQIIPPHDIGIAAAILQNLEPISWDYSVVEKDNLRVESVFDRVKDAYFKAVVNMVRKSTPLPVNFQSKFVYTPMHGVGLPFMTKVIEDICMLTDVSSSYGEILFNPVTANLARDHCEVFDGPPANGIYSFDPVAAGEVGMLHAQPGSLVETLLATALQCMVVVEEQAKPDPDFPTVKFPNPEEKGALDLAIKTADSHSLSLVVATDPDADRLAVAERVHYWHQYTGNQLGVLLASHVLSTYPASKDRSKLAMLCSAVSTGMLQAMAEVEGFHFQETLTGFKWLGNVALDLKKTGYDAVYAFEEAIGYMFSDVVHDKDGISAAAVFLAAVARWQNEEGLTAWGKLQRLYKKYGYFEDANTYLISPGPEITNRVFADIRRHGAPCPTRLGNWNITRWRDLTEGYDSATEDNVPHLPVSKSTQMITIELENGVKFTVRASGTEPKIKLYIEGRGDSSDEAKGKAESVRDVLIGEWFGRAEYGLVGP